MSVGPTGGFTGPSIGPAGDGPDSLGPAGRPTTWQPIESSNVRGKCDDLAGKLTEIRRLADERDDVPDGVEAALDDADEAVEQAMAAMEGKT